jgi:hypothetical protein
MDVELLLARDIKSDEVNVANSRCTRYDVRVQGHFAPTTHTI